ncbi:BTAD domain-containing putative transcriptional regulator [Nocardia aurantiaca]|uniref:AAA family ATPase n=1 Tax=Nocardia aurantiaca TaxID=2675850 RepID=A0A6I3LA84_9NOCA|nr:BTAD domain-containing putative transcriptional regulator [Nocardia aurantiaca]MTE17335.1 AAA family ATPase [Nocardia aurantiaca]
MALIRIGVLGPLHISIDEQRVPPGAPMQCAVLGRLVAAGGRVVPTERLIDDLWHGDPPAKAVAALQVYIHNLRRVFEPDRPRRAHSRVIVSESHGYALNLEPTQVDSWHFEQLLHRHEAAMRDPAGRPEPLEQVRVLDAALACWHGAAFESFPGMPWAAQEAARLQALRLTAAELRAQAALEMNRPAEVVLALRPILEEHPGREECARLLAVAQYRLGQSLDALATVRSSREFLTLEFGVDPGPGLRDLETAILTHSVDAETVTPPVPVRPAEPEPLPDSDSLPDNGYGTQRAAMLAAADAAAGGHARLVWLAGEAGAGKTTLARAITSHLRDRGWTTVFGRCPEVESAPPAWAWAEVLTGLDAADPETFTAADAFTLARRVVRSCRERSAGAPIVIVLEDVHGADPATLQVLRQVVNWLRDRPILIVATLRGTEACPGVRDTAAALAFFTADRIELDGLDMAGTRRAAAAAGLTALDDRTVELLRRRTGGNPLFVRELAKLVATQGTTDGLPDSVRDLLGRRIAQLPADVVDLLRHLSVWGEDSDITTLAASADHPVDTIIDLVATAESARLLRTDRLGRVTFDHALVRETVYYDIPTLRRTRMHWAAFEYLRRDPEPGPGTGGSTTGQPRSDLEADSGAGSASAAGDTPRAGNRVLAALRGADQVVAAMRGTARLATARPRQRALSALRGADEVATDPSGAMRRGGAGDMTVAASDNGEPRAAGNRLDIDAANAENHGAAAGSGQNVVGDRQAASPSDGLDDASDARAWTGDRENPGWPEASGEVPGVGDPVVRHPESHRARSDAGTRSEGKSSPTVAGTGSTRDEVHVPHGRDIDALAHHAALGADAETAAVALPYVRAAARRCVERRMRADAVRRWRSVLALHDLAGHATGEAELANRLAVLEARCELVVALAYDGQHIAARAVREQALDLAESLGGTGLLAHAVTCWPTPLIWSVHDWHTPDPRIREPLRIASADADLSVRTRIRVQVTAAFDRAIEDPSAARIIAAAAMALAEPLGDPDLLCTVINAQAFAAFAAGGFLRAHDLRRHARHLLQVSTEAELTEFRALAHYLLFRATLADADLAAAAEHAEHAGAYSTDGQLRHLLDALAPFGMVLELLRGDIDEVLRLLAEGSGELDNLVAHSGEGAAEPTRDPNALHVGIAVSIGWLRNDMSDYLTDLRERTALKPDLFVYGYALALVHSGRPEEARRVLAAAPPLAPQFWSTFTGVKARLAIALDDPVEAHAVYRQLLPYAGTICGLETGASVLGPMDYILAELAAYLGDQERAAGHRTAAEELQARLQSELVALASPGAGLMRAGRLGPVGRSCLVRRP